MKESSRFVQIPPICARAYVAAVKILKSKLGAGAPTFDALIQRELRNRDPHMIADDYLESRRARHAKNGRPQQGPARRRQLRALSPRAVIRGYSVAIDSERN